MATSLTLPELLAGRYRLGRALGEGGMAQVFWAWDELLRVERAVKVLQPEAAESPLIRTRLLGEATAMARLNHPNVLRVIDLNADHAPPFVVMELAVGGSLADRLERDGPLPVGEATHLIAQTCLALQAAHEAGIIHRDVKPQNILVGAGGMALLADFGIALLSGDGDLRTTRTNVAMGSMCFMAPEQRLDARAVGPAADVYAAACALYNLVTNENPIDLFTAAERSPRWLPLPAGLRGVLRRATAYDPEGRPPSARALAEQLLSVIGEDEAVPPALAEHTALALSWRPPTPGEQRSGGATAERTFDGLFPFAQSSMDPPVEAYTPTMPPAAQYTPTAPPGPLAGPLAGPLSGPVATPTASRVTAPDPQPRPRSRWIPLGAMALATIGITIWWATRPDAEPPPPLSAPITALDPGVPATPIAAPIEPPPPSAELTARVEEPTLSPAPTKGASAPKESAPRAAPDPVEEPGASALAGEWQGAFSGYVARLTLRGDDDALSGVFVVQDRSGVVMVNSPVAGRFDGAAQVLRLSDIDQSQPDAASYTLRLTKPTRLDGESTGAHNRSSVKVILNRSP
ncbi:protein kinase [Myxococcota bacterium]|nr:protein kinase [Myxococcota bacterium]